MPPAFRFALVASAGFALGIGAATLAERPGPTASLAPAVDVRGGAIVGKMDHTLRPVSVRTGDDSRSVGAPLSSPPVERRSSVAVVSLDVNGVPVRLEFEVEPVSP
jgi:hypothetical protein